MSTINVDNINPASQSQVTIGPLNLTGTVETGTFTASAVLNVEVNGVPYKLLLAETTTPSNSFMFTVNTAIAGSSSNNQFTIPTTGIGYNYTVTTSEETLTNQTGNCTLTWATPGTYSVEITGDFPRIYFFNIGDKDKIIEVQRWGNIGWISFENAFFGCSNLDITATDAPVLTNVNSMSNCFRSCSSLENSNVSIGLWDVSNVTNMQGMFMSCINPSFSDDLSSWNVSNVTDMSYMFSNMNSFNSDISNWDVSSVTNMRNMFDSCNPFNQDISNWNVSSVTDMQAMFATCLNFNSNIGGWTVSNVTNMNNMFNSSNFNQNIGGWDVSSVTDMQGMFQYNDNFNQPIGNWNVSNVTNMRSMFGSPTFPVAFNQDISGWTVSNVTNMEGMFENATSFNQDISGWNVAQVTTMERMFKNATSFNQYIGIWNTVNVANMESMFENATSFNQQLDAWSLTNVNNMTNFMSGKSTSNYSYYDDLLINFESTIAQSGVTLDMGTIQYTSTGATSRQNIIDNYSWTINDGGQI